MILRAMLMLLPACCCHTLLMPLPLLLMLVAMLMLLFAYATLRFFDAATCCCHMFAGAADIAADFAALCPYAAMMPALAAITLMLHC